MGGNGTIPSPSTHFKSMSSNPYVPAQPRFQGERGVNKRRGRGRLETEDRGRNPGLQEPRRRLLRLHAHPRIPSPSTSLCSQTEHTGGGLWESESERTEKQMSSKYQGSHQRLEFKRSKLALHCAYGWPSLGSQAICTQKQGSCHFRIVFLIRVSTVEEQAVLWGLEG